MGRAKELTDVRFGRLVAKEATSKRDSGSVVWICECDCTARTTVSARNLVNGHTTSCGCAKGKSIETGERFGSLVAKERVGTTKKGQALWRCECVCGSETLAPAAELRFGNITSCGCGATKLKRIAESNGNVDGTRLNALGSKPAKNNTSGVRGVTWVPSRGKWRAQIKFQGHRRYLGEYVELEDATEARRKAERELFDPVLEAHGMKVNEGKCCLLLAKLSMQDT